MDSSVRVTVCTSRRRSMWCLKWWPHVLQSHTWDSILSGGECPCCLRCWQALSEFLSPSEGTPARALKDKGVRLSSPDCSSCTGSALGPPDQIPSSGQPGLFLEERRAGGRHTRNLFSTTGHPERLWLREHCWPLGGHLFLWLIWAFSLQLLVSRGLVAALTRAEVCEATPGAPCWSSLVGPRAPGQRNGPCLAAVDGGPVCTSGCARGGSGPGTAGYSRQRTGGRGAADARGPGGWDRRRAAPARLAVHSNT